MFSGYKTFFPNAWRAGTHWLQSPPPSPQVAITVKYINLQNAGDGASLHSWRCCSPHHLLVWWSIRGQVCSFP